MRLRAAVTALEISIKWAHQLVDDCLGGSASLTLRNPDLAYPSSVLTCDNIPSMFFLKEVAVTLILKTHQAVKLLIDAYNSRGDAIDWSDVVVEPFDKSVDSACIGYSATFERLMNTKTLCDAPHLTKPLCAVLASLLYSTPDDEKGDLSNFFFKSGAKFIKVYAEKGETLGHFDGAAAVFRNLNVQLTKSNRSPEDFSVKALTDFVTSDLDVMKPEDLQPFLAYGSKLTHLHQQGDHQEKLKKFVMYNHDEDGEFPTLPMNQALISVYIGAMGRAAYRIADSDHLPEQPFALALLRLSDEVHKLNSAGCHIPGCQFVDLKLVSQTITAISKAYSLTDDPAVRKRYEQGVGALVNLTLKSPSAKLVVVGSAYAPTAHVQKVMLFQFSDTGLLIDRMIQEARDRPLTGSAVIEKSAIRFNRQVYLEAAFRAHNSPDLDCEEGKARLMALADLAREGLRDRSDFDPLGNVQKLWLTKESGDERTKMTILETHPELRKDTFVHDLGM